MTCLIIATIAFLLGLIARPRLSKAFDFLKSAWGE